MFSKSFIVLAAVLGAVNAAVVGEQCRPSFTNTTLESIVSSDEPTLTWTTFVTQGGGNFDDISVSAIDPTSTEQQYVLTSAPGGNAYSIEPSNPSSGSNCVALTGGPVNSAPCTFPQPQLIQWFITCETCTGSVFTQCLIQSAFEGQYAGYSDELGGAIEGTDLEDTDFDFHQLWDIHISASAYTN